MERCCKKNKQYCFEWYFERKMGEATNWKRDKSNSLNEMLIKR
jgi:hypothetical protein